MLKKAGMLTVGVTAGLLAVAPLANAGVSDSDKDVKGHSKHDDDHGKDRDKDHKKKSHKDDDGDQKGTGNIKCSNESGDLDNDTNGEGLVGIGQVAGPVASGNAGNILSCNSFLNDNLNNNAISVGILGDAGALSE